MIHSLTFRKPEGKTVKSLIVVFLHGILWLAIFSLPLVFRPRMGLDSSMGDMTFHIPMPLLVNDVFLIIAFYINLFVLMPELFNKKRWGLYVVFTCLFIIGTLFVHGIAKELDVLFGGNGSNGPPRQMGDGRMRGNFEFRQFSFLYTFAMVWSISMVYFLINQLQKSKRHAERVNASALQSELSFLKAQINPHFLFNTLNNIYVLSLKKSDDAPKAIMKLSNLMRQLTNDTAVDYVSLEDEERFIRDYIELQEMRLSNTTRVNYSVEGTYQHLRIAARLLIPFIDNAFKYGVSNRTPSTIDIRFSFNGSKMTFDITNAIHPNSAEKFESSSGVGLENVTRRLDLLYKNNYFLKRSQTATSFSIHLEINLS